MGEGLRWSWIPSVESMERDLGEEVVVAALGEKEEAAWGNWESMI